MLTHIVLLSCCLFVHVGAIAYNGMMMPYDSRISKSEKLGSWVELPTYLKGPTWNCNGFKCISKSFNII